MRRKAKIPLQVTSFRLPPDVHTFLKEQAVEQDRTMSYILVDVLRKWMFYLAKQEEQPGMAKKK